jgi:hypothetical protein
MRLFLHICWSIGCSLLALSISGCIIFPVPRFDTAETRDNISEQVISRFEPEKTTRREVMLVLGEPDAVSIDERKLIYSTQQVVAYAVFPYVGGGVSPIPDIDFFVAEFDAQGVLLKFAEVKRYPELIPRLANYGGYKIIFQKKALQIKPEHVGGTLLLTDSEIIFISDRQMSNADPEFRVIYAKITDVRLKSFKTTLAVECQTGSEYRFMISGWKGMESLQKAHNLIQAKINP